jgi:hypothetical protein
VSFTARDLERKFAIEFQNDRDAPMPLKKSGLK